jgi:hypothetical protein
VPGVVAEIKTYSTGRYGLVDVFYRHIWINHWSEQDLHFVSRAFWPKVATTVFDLKCFENFSESTVDSEVSLNWKIPVCQDWRSHLTRLSFKNVNLFATQTEYESSQLINEPTACNLTHQRQRDLQNQMLLLISVLDCISYRSTFFHPSPEAQKLSNEIKQIFLTEIDTDLIHEKLYELASAGITGPDDNYAKILHMMGKTYA